MASEALFRVALLHLLLAMVSMFHPYIPHFEFYFAMFAIYISGKEDNHWIGLFFVLNLLSFAFGLVVVISYWSNTFSKTVDSDLWATMNQVGFGGYAGSLVTKLAMEFLAFRWSSENGGTLGTLCSSFCVPPTDVGQKEYVSHANKPSSVQADTYEPPAEVLMTKPDLF